MLRIPKIIKPNPYLLLLGLILIIALFFRSYKLVDWFEFAHDGDLYSWIVKDILVDGHSRLIGQQTTAPGIFIGPLFYYMLIPFFILTKMDPVGAVFPITIIGVLTVASYYFVFSRLFNKEIGLLTAFLYATLLSLVYFDRRVVPSTPTNLWLIWYFFTLIMIARGKLNVLPLLGFLIGLIWHIHIALLPALAPVPLALILSKKLPTIKQLSLFVAGLFLPSIPFIAFELKHNFVQTISFIKNFSVDHAGGTGVDKLNLVIIKITGNIDRLFFYPQGLDIIGRKLTVLLLLMSPLILIKKELLIKKEALIFYFWITVIVLYYTFSSTQISEYYFANIEIIFLTFASLLLYILYKSSNIGRFLTLSILSIILVKNVVHFLTTDIYHKGYNERKNAANFIKSDSKAKNFTCVSISYITSPGENVGFRYFFWLNELHTVQVQKDSATYTIVTPTELAWGKDEKQFGQIKVITPEEIPSKEDFEIICSGQNSNLTDSMFGFTK